MTLVRGLVPGRVKALDDSHRGQVQVEFPVEIEEGLGVAEDWARVVTMMAGDDRGSWFMPEVGDEVLVGFGNEDAEDPYVVGFVWSEPPGATATPPDGAAPGQRQLKSKRGHTLTFDDTDANLVRLTTKDGHRLLLDEAGGKVVLTTGDSPAQTITLDAGTITLEDAQGHTITLDSSGIALAVGARRIVMSNATIDFY